MPSDNDQIQLIDIMYSICDIYEIILTLSSRTELGAIRYRIESTRLELLFALSSVPNSLPKKRDGRIQQASRAAKFRNLPAPTVALLVATNTLCAANEDWDSKLIDEFGLKRAAIMRKGAAGRGDPNTTLGRAYRAFERAVLRWECAAHEAEIYSGMVKSE